MKKIIILLLFTSCGFTQKEAWHNRAVKLHKQDSVAKAKYITQKTVRP